MDITKHGIHLLSTDSAAGSWRMAFDAEDRLLVYRDALSSGPLRACNGLDTWNAMRLAYWNEVSQDWVEEIFGNPDERGLALDLVGNAERLRDAEAIYIWVGTNVHDQLFLLFAVHLVEQIGGDPDRIRVVQFENIPKFCNPFFSIAMLNPEQVAKHPQPIALTVEQLRDFQTAWSVLTETTPLGIMTFIDEKWKVWHHLTRALGRILQRFPWEAMGLPFWDGCLLHNVEHHGPCAAHVIAHTLEDFWKVGDSVGDVVLYYRLQQLVSEQLPKPLIEFHGKSRMYRDTQVTLTSFGKAVVDGRESSYPTNPIHDWVARVRVSPTESALWINSEKGLRRIPPLQ